MRDLFISYDFPIGVGFIDDRSMHFHSKKKRQKKKTKKKREKKNKKKMQRYVCVSYFTPSIFLLLGSSVGVWVRFL